MLKSILIIACTSFAVFCHSQGFENLGDSLGFDNSYGDGEYGCGVSFVDFNQDGLDDITYPSGPFDDLYFHVNTGGVFELADDILNNGSEVKQMLWVDYDNDYDYDLYVTSKVKNQLYKNLGDLEFENITNSCGFNDPISQSFCSVWLDYDEDGLLDLCVTHRLEYLVGTVTLYRNLGDDQFEDVTLEAGITAEDASSPLAITTLDYNNDGWEDIYIGQDYFRGNILLKNNGDGTFDDVSEESGTNAYNNTMTASIGDYNNDGWMEIYVTNTPEGNKFYVNQGDGTFIDQAEEKNVKLNQFTWGAVFLDAENDLDQDLFVNGNYNSFNISSNMMMNQGNELFFIPINDFWGITGEQSNSVGNAIGDFNNDGYADIFKTNKDSPHTMWKNSFTGSNYIKVHLTAQISNSMGIGSVVKVATGETIQTKRLACGEGFGSQNSNTMMFGLGDYEDIDSIMVDWPNGIQTTLYDVVVNQTLEINEFIEGCIDSNACNFDPTATDNDSSCEYPLDFYSCEGICLNDEDLDLICDENEIPGCSDPLSCNFNSLATDEDGSCIYAEEFFDCEGNCILDSDEDGICDELEIYGCTDSNACNYDFLATEEDDSCTYLVINAIQGNEISVVNQLETYSYDALEGSTLDWSCDNCSIISGQGSEEISLIWTETGIQSIYVQETSEEDCQGEESSFSVDISAVSLFEINGIRKVHYLYPNPAHNELYINSSNNTQFPMVIQIYNSNGKLLDTKRIDSSQQVYDCSNLPTGIYQIILIGNAIYHSESILIMH